MPNTRTVRFENRRGEYRRLVITDRGCYQRVALYDASRLIGEFAYSADESGIYDTWPFWGEALKIQTLREAGLF